MAVIDKAQEQLFAPGKSSRAKYAELVVGRPGFGALLKYELIVMLAQSWPGALGLALRKLLYPMLLGSCGRNVIFGQHVVLRHPHKIRIGSNVVLDDNCLVDAKGESNRGITIGDGVFVGRNTILSCKNGDIDLGDTANIGFNCEVFSARLCRSSPGLTTIFPIHRSRCWSSRGARPASPSATASGSVPARKSSTGCPSAKAR